MSQTVLLCYLVIAGEVNCWKNEFRLLHIVVNSLIEVLTHVGFENDGKVVTVPLTLVSTLNGLSW